MAAERPFELSEEDRAKLRPSVNAPVLERVLGEVPEEMRRVLLVSCFRNPGDADLLSIGIKVPSLPEAPAPRPSERVILPDGREGRRLPFLPARNIHLKIQHLEDPKLDALWQQVEVSDGAA
jgi:hypothetical protein